MKRLSFLLAAALLVGCGSGGGSSSHPPTLSNLRYSPTAAMVNDGGGTITVTGYCDFTDSGGDLDTAVITICDNNGTQLGSTSAPIPHNGATAGVLIGNVTVPTTAPGIFTFSVVVCDSVGSASNALAGTFSVNPDPWQPRSNPLSPGTQITSVAYGGGIFLAGASDNSVLGSFDGSSWSRANLGIGKAIRRICYGNGRFVAIAENDVDDTLIASTDNGATWTTAQQTFSRLSCRDVSFGNGIFFVTQENSDDLYASTDNGATWRVVSSRLAVGNGMDAPAYGDGMFVAAVNGGNTLVSADGIGWALGNPYGGYFRPQIAFDNGVFAIVPLLGDVYVSRDHALTWQKRFTIPSLWWMSDLAAGDGIYVGVGRMDGLQQMGVLCASSRGDSWVSRTLGTSALRGIAYGKGTFVAVGDNATIYQSAPGWRP